MLPIRRELILAVVLIAPVVLPQSVVPRTEGSTSQPPPPVRVEEKKAAPPQPIRVGGNVQAPYLGPEGRWVPLGKRLSDAEITAYEQSLFVNPEDICTRARLISFAYYRTPNFHTANRIDHLLWMIQRHPEWEGFILGPSNGLSEGRSNDERAGYIRLRQAWLEQVGPQQTRGIVLHNAAMFFAIREPAFAAELLQRAIAAEPDVPLYVERLGMYMPTRSTQNLSCVDTILTPYRSAKYSAKRRRWRSYRQTIGSLWREPSATCNRKEVGYLLTSVGRSN